jgi:F-type H+-transporting ATPase subunit epsilon
MPIRLEVVTQERIVYSDDVDMVVAPGVEGVLGILPHHAPLLTALRVGELKIKKAGQEEFFAVSGGFMEVRPEKIIVLAETAEQAEEIDTARAEAARERAERALKERPSGADLAALEQALHRSRLRLHVARRRIRREARGGPPIEER